MSFLLTVLLLLVIVACVGMTYTEGMWTNALRLINVVTAGLVATNFFEPLAAWFQSMMPSATYLCDFIALWVLFLASLRHPRRAYQPGVASESEVLEDRRRHRGRILRLVDRLRDGVLHHDVAAHGAAGPHRSSSADFSRNIGCSLVWQPDRDWLAFMQKMSLGTFSASASEAEVKQEKYVFDPQGEFMLKYANRRKELEECRLPPRARC